MSEYSFQENDFRVRVNRLNQILSIEVADEDATMRSRNFDLENDEFSEDNLEMSNTSYIDRPILHSTLADAVEWDLAQGEALRDRTVPSMVFAQKAKIFYNQPTCIINALSEMEALFRGAAYISLEDLGIPLSKPIEPAIRLSMSYARRFITTWKEDPQLLTDCRMMVPLYYDRGKNKTRVSVVCGFMSRHIIADFERKPEVQITDSLGNFTEARITWSSTSYSTVYPIQFECDVSQIMNRQTFRELASQYSTASRLRAVLETL